MESWTEWTQSLMTLLAGWSYAGMFLAAFAAGSLIPLGSEVLFALLIQGGCDPWGCLAAATAGNTLGGMTCYWTGMLGKREWIGRWLGVSDEKLARASRFLQGRGAWMGFFAFLPYLGEAVAVGLGLMRSNGWLTAASMALGKGLRYGVILLLMGA